jgi:tRNA 2-selenouridine synthase
MTEMDFNTAQNLKQTLYIDVRSPGEYAQDHIPGALNLPLFSDEERERIGTVYRQLDQKQARYLGLEIITPKLVSLLRQLEGLLTEGQPVIYCWRGGMRSKALYQMARLLQIPCHRLLGGYKAYRQEVNNYFAALCPFRIVVLHGLTGCGKTRILQMLQSEKQVQVIDLEGLAQNRGSVFGGVGLKEQPSQKRFESRLFEAMTAYDPACPLIVECESKRIGKLLLPTTFYQAMQEGRHFLIYGSLAARTSRIVEEYRPGERKEEIVEALQKIKERLGKEKILWLIDLVKTGNFLPVVEYLLEYYYDPLYNYPDKADSAYEISLCSDNEEKAIRDLSDYLN